MFASLMPETSRDQHTHNIMRVVILCDDRLLCVLKMLNAKESQLFYTEIHITQHQQLKSGNNNEKTQRRRLKNCLLYFHGAAETES